ncbi:MAG: amidohydrolase [Bryobacter sp.]|nr:amidohydrolase [Bryobacter sp.]
MDWLVTAGTVLPMDAALTVHSPGAVAIQGSRIVAVGPAAELAKQYRPKRRLDRPQALLTPGLINAHAHAPMSLLRGIADDRRLDDWLENFIFPAEAKNVNRDFCFWGTQLACAEMLLAGVTTYVDMYYFEEEIARATKLAGMRAVLGQTMIQFPVPDAKDPAAARERCEAFFRAYDKDELITPAIAPHALYTNSEADLRAARALANRYGKPLVIHIAETRKERDDMQAKYGASPVATLARWGIFDGPTISAHTIWVDAEDIAILARHKVGLAHCPSSNMKLASGVAPVVAQRRAELRVGLGTDGPAGSNNDFHLLEELDLAAKLQKVTQLDPQLLGAKEVLAMATREGAEAVHLAKTTGSLEPGKAADLVLWNLATPNATPSFDPYSTLVYSAKSADVIDVFVHGRPVVRERRLLTLNQDAILAKARTLQQQIVLSLKK